jgi:5-methylcytosine-specific restriction enzyme A
MASLATENDLHSELLSLYRRTGVATGYWAHYFLRDVRKDGGLAVAKKLLRANRVSTGFDRLIAARRADLSIEFIALSPRFKHLFSAEERAVAAKRIKPLPRSAFPTTRVRNPAFPTELVGDAYSEGSVERVSVNRYERNGRARLACIRHHGARCAACDIDFEERYGGIGKGFIHVHHKKPLAALGKRYRLDAVKDLVPVCPNCHAMLHKREPPYDVEELRAILRSV